MAEPMSGRSLTPQIERNASASRAFARDHVREASPLHELSALHQRFGNRATGLLLQTKLRVGDPNDRYEREADRVADQVMRTPDPVAEELHPVAGRSLIQPCSCGGTCASCSAHKKDDEELFAQRQPISDAPLTMVQREATESCKVTEEPPEPEEVQEDADEKQALEEGEKAEDEAAAADASDSGGGEDSPNVQPKRSGDGVPTPANVETRIERTRGSGDVLPHDTRQFMESRLGHDFSGVRIHTDTESHRLNRDLNSLAFATGRDIYFAPGQFQPKTASGQHLLAHELTHVVQQAGGRGGVVREKADPTMVSRAGPERKTYYYSLHGRSGTAIHNMIEGLLRAANTNLVTEAAIPGANRFSPALNKVGIADLYASSPPNTVAGVKGLRDVDKPEDVIAMDRPGSRRLNTQPTNVTSSPVRTGTGSARGWSGVFPTKVLVGEIKPLSASKVGAGIFQLDNYINGYKAFVARINQLSKGTTGASIDMARLSITIPTNLNWDNFATQAATPAPRSTVNNRRFWVADLTGGVYAYFDLDAGLRGGRPPRFDQEVQRMREIRDDLTRERPRTETLDSLTVSPKSLSGRRNIAPLPEAPRERLVQRNTKDRPANYWSDRGREWEEKRSKWGKGFRQAIRSEFRQYRDKMRVEKKLGRSSRSAPAAEKAESKEFSQLMFWSGLPGRFLGKVRFLFGSAWDKIMGIFEKFKEKIHGLRTKVNATSGEGMVSVGWQKTLLKILVKVAKAVTIKFFTESFNFFVDCFHSAMDKVFAKIQAELTEMFAEQLCWARKYFEDSKKRLEEQWGISFNDLAELVSTIQDATHWVDIAMGLITAIRLGVQAISCLSPPAFGCLWGLVAQVGIGTALDLLIGTRWFDDNIVTPTIRDLVRKYASPYYQKLINRALGDDLKEYWCHIADDQFPKLAYAGDSTGIEGASLIAHRDSWEKRNHGAIVKDLQFVFKTGKGQPATEEQLKKLVEEIKKLRESGKTADEIKEMVMAGRDAASGKLDVQEATNNVTAGEVPEEKKKERKIDYPKATKANVQYQQQLHWDPLTFYAKPGVAVDSEEFADAVYDLQDALHIHADGILGDLTVKAFYDRNKLKKDAAYAAAVQVQEERKAAKEKAEQAKKEREKKEAESKAKSVAQSDEIAAIGVPKPPAGTEVTDDYLSRQPVNIGLPFGTVDPALTGKETKGTMLTADLAFRIDRKWVWFLKIPCTLDSAGTFNKSRTVDITTTEDFYFKLSPTDTKVYVYSKGTHMVWLDWAEFEVLGTAH